MNKFVNNFERYSNNLNELKIFYKNADPFPHIVLDDFFNEKTLKEILESFPENIEKKGVQFNSKTEKKFSLNDTDKFSEATNSFINFLNSYKFLDFLNKITDIDEKLIPDPYLIGGGFHELKNGGFLNIHADFNIHPHLKLDRRLNMLIYLNQNWDQKFGGSLELWGNDMKKCAKKITPNFNRVVIFSTTGNSYHGNPEKIAHPENISRKSIALYYYSNGRPSSEYRLGKHSTIFRKRPNIAEEDTKFDFKKIIGNIFYKIKK
jgi:Rps23 Pro-64 3,4-dihydroxylase Tpa1-like proline 4-hydroxylase